MKLTLKKRPVLCLPKSAPSVRPRLTIRPSRGQSRPLLVGPRGSTLDQLDRTKLVGDDAWISFDTETTGLDPWGTMGVDRKHWPARPFFVSICDPDGQTYWERWNVDARTRRVIAEPSDALVALLEDKSIAKVAFNAPIDVRGLRLSGLNLRGRVIDVLLMAHVLDPDAFDKRLKPLCKKWLDITIDDEEAVLKSTQKGRAAVRLARMRLARGKPIASDTDLAAYAIYEAPQSEYDEKKKTDNDSAKADMWLADPQLLETYGVKDAERTAMLYLACKDALDRGVAGEAGWANYEMEQELQPVVMRMEEKGIAAEKEKVAEIVEFYHELVKDHDAAIEAEVGDEFNTRSWKCMQREFFRNRKYRPLAYSVKKKRTEEGRIQKEVQCQWCKGRGCETCQQTGKSPICDGEFLAHIGIDHSGDEPAPKDKLAWHILHQRACQTMLGYICAYDRYLVREGDHWILHPNFKQAGPVTNRFAAEKPNLQNVADDDSGKKKVDVPYRSREPFIPRKGRVLYLPDYSQIEIWVLYLRSKDENLGKILLSGGDTHGKVAAQCVPGAFDLEQALKDKDVDPAELTPGRLANLKAYTKNRKKAKNTQFCKVYGGGAGKIAKTAGCTFAEAEEFSARYESSFPGIAQFMRDNISFARKHGYIENAFGRRYPIESSRAYVATNYDIQGSAADLIKRAMIRVHKLQCEKYDGKMDLLLTIHDELAIEADLSIHKETTMRDIATAMQADYTVLGCPVPFPVGMKVATERWGVKLREVKL